MFQSLQLLFFMLHVVHIHIQHLLFYYLIGRSTADGFHPLENLVSGALPAFRYNSLRDVWIIEISWPRSLEETKNLALRLISISGLITIPIRMQTLPSSVSQLLSFGLVVLVGMSGLVSAGDFGGMPMDLERDLAGKLVGRVVPTGVSLQVRYPNSFPYS